MNSLFQHHRGSSKELPVGALPAQDQSKGPEDFLIQHSKIQSGQFLLIDIIMNADLLNDFLKTLFFSIN